MVACSWGSIWRAAKAAMWRARSVGSLKGEVETRMGFGVKLS
jgi:hypothetical protein